MGKLGILWQLDRTDGRFIAAHDLGYQTLVQVDPVRGRAVYKPEVLPKAGVEFTFCPDIQGVRGWQAMAYDPGTGALLIPIRPACGSGVFYDTVAPNNVGPFRWYGNTALNGSKMGPSSAHPKMPDHRGELISMDVGTGQVRWRLPMSAPATISALTTAGGIAVSGDEDRHLYVVDTATGKPLFQTRLAAPLDGSAITYAAGGRQFIAVGTQGTGGRSGNALYAFALPDGIR
jgi:alcohol dehydrogenase (cytochrome c)